MGTMFGAVTMLSSLGMAIGPWAGGLVFDTFHGYAWLYIGSASIGLAAVAIALAFPSARRAAQPSPISGGRRRRDRLAISATLIVRGGWVTIRLHPRTRECEEAHEQASGLDLVDRAQALAPLIAREADEIERTRRLTRRW